MSAKEMITLVDAGDRSTNDPVMSSETAVDNTSSGTAQSPIEESNVEPVPPPGGLEEKQSTGGLENTGDQKSFQPAGEPQQTLNEEAVADNTAEVMEIVQNQSGERVNGFDDGSQLSKPPEEPMSEKMDVDSNQETKNSLWISNLPASTPASDLKLLFTEFGKVTAAKIYTTRSSNNPTCYGVSQSTSLPPPSNPATQLQSGPSQVQPDSVATQFKSGSSQVQPQQDSSQLSMTESKEKTTITAEPPKSVVDKAEPPKSVVDKEEPPKSVVNKTEPPKLVVDKATVEAPNPLDKPKPKPGTSKPSKKPNIEAPKSSEKTKPNEKDSSLKDSPKPSTSKKPGVKVKVPIKAPETSSSKPQSSNQSRRDKYKPRAQNKDPAPRRRTSPADQSKNSPTRQSRVSPIRSSINVRRTGRRRRSREARADRSGRDVRFRDSLPRRQVLPPLEQSRVTSSGGQLFTHEQVLQITMDAERKQRENELILERERQRLLFEKERNEIERQKMEIKRKNELFEMEKLRFEFKKAKESEQRAYEALARSQSHSAHPRDKKPSPRVEVHRESGGSSRHRSRSPHRSSSTRDKRPAPPHSGDSARRSERENHLSNRSSSSSTRQTPQLSTYVEPSSLSSNRSQQLGSTYPITTSVHAPRSTANPPRLDSKMSKDAVYEKRLAEISQIAPSSGHASNSYTRLGSYDRSVVGTSYGKTSYSRAEVDSRYVLNPSTGSYGRDALDTYGHTYPQLYVTSSVPGWSSSAVASASYDAQGNWRGSNIGLSSSSSYSMGNNPSSLEYPTRRF